MNRYDHESFCFRARQ